VKKYFFKIFNLRNSNSIWVCLRESGILLLHFISSPHFRRANEAPRPAGLPDGICFLYQISRCWYILEGVGIEIFGIGILWSLGIVSYILVYIIAIWYILWSLASVSPLLVCFTKKNLAALLLAAVSSFFFVFLAVVG
jgi:hypothetical protein